MNIGIISKGGLQSKVILSWIKKHNPESNIQLIYAGANKLIDNIAEWDVLIYMDYIYDESFSIDSRHSFALSARTMIAIIETIDLKGLAFFAASDACAIVDWDESLDFLDNLQKLENTSHQYISPSLQAYLAKKPDGKHPLLSLSILELLICSQILLEKSTKEIANFLKVSVHTVSDYRKKIKYKLSIQGGKSAFLTYLEEYKLWIIREALRLHRERG
jgi:DNA-binding CsgD family transcriptional regulator